MFGINNGGYDVSSECRTNLVEEILVNLAATLVLVRTDFKGCTVGSQATHVSGAYAWTKVTANDSGTHKTNLRLFFFKKLYKNAGMRFRSIRIESFRIKYMKLVDTIGKNL